MYRPKNLATIRGLMESLDFCKSVSVVALAQSYSQDVIDRVEGEFERRYDVGVEAVDDVLLITKTQPSGSAYHFCDRVVVAPEHKLPFCYVSAMRQIGPHRISYQDEDDRAAMRMDGWDDRLTNTMEEAETC